MKKIHYVGLAIFFILWGFLIYANTFYVPFQFDDREFIVRNGLIKDLALAPQIWSQPGSKLRFIGFFSFALNYHFHQLDVFGFHLTNLIIHLVNTFLVGWFVLLTFNTPRIKDETKLVQSRNAIVWGTCVLFLTHPIQTQAVTYITQRFTSLATLFYLAALCLYIMARTSEIKLMSKVIIYGGSALCTVLGMLTKQIAFTLPFIILLYEFIFISVKGHAASLNRKQLTLLLAVALGIAMIIPGLLSFDFTQAIPLEGNSRSFVGDRLTVGTYALTQLRVITTYLKVLFFPYKQNLIYDFPLSRHLFEPTTFASFLLLSGIFAGGVWLLPRSPIIAFGVFWFFVTLSVESSIIPIPHVIFEHRCYLPSVGLFFALSASLLSLIDKKNYFYSAIIIIGLTLSLLTFMRNEIWKDPISLWGDVAKKSPLAFRSIYNLGTSFLEAGRYDEALDAFQRSLAINPASPGSAKSYANVGLIYRLKGNRELAIEYLSKAIDRYPQLTIAYINRGDVYNDLKKYDLALADYSKVISLRPQYPQIYNNRGNIYKLNGQYDLALADYESALALDPSLVQVYNNRGVIFKIKGQGDKALLDYNKAIDLDPNYATAYFNRAQVYLLQGDQEKAKMDMQKAKTLVRSKDDQYLKFLTSTIDE